MEYIFSDKIPDFKIYINNILVAKESLKYNFFHNPSSSKKSEYCINFSHKEMANSFPFIRVG